MNNATRASLLPVVIFALAVFAVLKIGNLWIGVADVNAQEQGQSDQANSMQPIKIASSETPHRDAPAPDIHPGETERRILTQLAARRAALDEREDAIRAREVMLAAAEKKIEQKITALETEQEQLIALRSARDEDQAQEIEMLVSAYERMKSKDAAAIFNALEHDILVPVAAGMRTQALAGVLAEMQPDKARLLTKMLAERNQIDVALAAPIAE